MDNTTAISYIGHKIQEPSSTCSELRQWCQERGSTHTIGGAPSRSEQCHSGPRIFHRVETELRGVPEHSRHSGPVYSGSVRDTVEHPSDQLQELETRPLYHGNRCSEDFMEAATGIAFSPFSLIGRCLHKIRLDQAAILLIAPVWLTQAWYPLLLESLVQVPVLLPSHQDLLKDPFDQTHPLLQDSNLALVMWKVSRIVAEQKEFRENLSSYQQAGARAQMQCMNQPGPSGGCDPLSCGPKSLVADMFKQGLQHSSINTIRSAVSMTHNPVEGTPIGQHPSVSRLMRGIHNTHPPKPRYTSNVGC